MSRATISLPGAGLAGDEDGALGLRDQLRALDDFFHRPAAPDDAVVVELGVAFADQVLALGLQAETLDRPAGERQQLVDLERLLEEILDAELERLAHDLRRAVRGHQDDLRPFGRRLLRQLANQLQSGDAGHQVVDDEQVERALGQVPLRLADAGRLDDLVSLVSQCAAQPLQDLFLVVGEQDRTAAGCHACAPGDCCGRSMRISVPSPRRLETASVPPSPSMMFFAIGSPRPVPARRVVK